MSRELGREVVVRPVRGSNQFGLPAMHRTVPLKDRINVPVGTTLDSRRGAVRIVADETTASATAAQRAATPRATAVFSGGRFSVSQPRSRRAVTELRLQGGNFRRCGQRARAGAVAVPGANPIRRLRGSGRGNYRTRGRRSSATVRGTEWEVVDRCDGTLTEVFRGEVEVFDFGRKRTITLRAGQRYLARAPWDGPVCTRGSVRLVSLAVEADRSAQGRVGRPIRWFGWAPLVVLIAFFALAPGSASAGRLLVTGHDADLHCSGGSQCHYVQTAVSYVRAGAPDPTKPVLVLDRLDLDFVVALDAAFGAGVVPREVMDPRSPQFASAPLTTSRYSAILIASDLNCGGCDLNESDSTPDSDAISARKADIAAFFNAGGGVYANSGATHGDGDPTTGTDNYYSFLPLPVGGKTVAPPFCLTPVGASLGFEDPSWLPGRDEAARHQRGHQLLRDPQLVHRAARRERAPGSRARSGRGRHRLGRRRPGDAHRRRQGERRTNRRALGRSRSWAGRSSRR